MTLCTTASGVGVEHSVEAEQVTDDNLAGVGERVGAFMLTSLGATPPPAMAPLRPSLFQISYWQCDASTRMRSFTKQPNERALYNRLRRKLIVLPRPATSVDVPSAESASGPAGCLQSASIELSSPALRPRFLLRPVVRFSDLCKNAMCQLNKKL